MQLITKYIDFVAEDFWSKSVLFGRLVVFGNSADFKFLEAYEGTRKEKLVSKMWWGKRGLNYVILQATNIYMCRVQMSYVAWYIKMQQLI